MKNTVQWIRCTALALSCLATPAMAQDIDRRGPNVMPPPHDGAHHSNNAPAYDGHAAPSRRGPNVMPAPRAGRAPAPADGVIEAAPGASERGPNIVGEAQTQRPGSAGNRNGSNGSNGRDGSDGGDGRRPAGATPECNKCVAI